MNVTEYSSSNEKALLFIVDIENMLKEKTILKKQIVMIQLKLKENKL